MNREYSQLRCEISLIVQEWSLWNTIGDTVLHIELRRWADCVVLAPASANTIAKMTAGSIKYLKYFM